MERFPTKFEEEVLNPAGIHWISDLNPNYIHEDSENRWTSPYEIAGLGLEAIMKKDGYLMRVYSNEFVIGIPYQVLTDCCKYKDFCECIFAAIREIYK